MHDEDEELGEKLIDLLGRLEIVQLAQEVGGQVDVNRLGRLNLQRGMTKAEAGTQGAKAAATALGGEMSALRVRTAGKDDGGGAGCLRIHGLSFLGSKGVSTPVAMERVQKALNPKELQARRCRKECASR